MPANQRSCSPPPSTTSNPLARVVTERLDTWLAGGGWETPIVIESENVESRVVIKKEESEEVKLGETPDEVVEVLLDDLIVVGWWVHSDMTRAANIVVAYRERLRSGNFHIRFRVEERDLLLHPRRVFVPGTREISDGEIYFRLPYHNLTREQRAALIGSHFELLSADRP